MSMRDDVEEVEKMMEELQVAERKNGQGNALFSEEKYQEAIVSYQVALDNLGSGEEADVRLRSQILCNIGDCHFKLGRYKEALESFSEARGIDSNWEEPFMKMSDVMEKRLKKVKLERERRVALKELFEDLDYWVTLGLDERSRR